MERYELLRGTDWRGDAYWTIYDTFRGVSFGPRFYAKSHAQDYVDVLTLKVTA